MTAVMVRPGETMTEQDGCLSKRQGNGLGCEWNEVDVMLRVSDVNLRLFLIISKKIGQAGENG
jgi:hypothetical protein